MSRIEFRKKMFDAPVEKELEVSWMKDHMAAPMLFAAVDDEEQIAGYLELNPERWNNRMRVANLFVEEPFRRTGVGTVLMRHAVSVAEKAGARMLVLETELQHAGDWFLSVPGFCHRRAGPVPLFQ